MVRGMTGAGLKLRPEARLVQGRWFNRGLREVVVSESLSRRFRDMRWGRHAAYVAECLESGGVFNAGGTAFDSEIWADYEDIAQDWDRPIYSSILLRTPDAVSTKAIRNRIADDRRIHLQAVPQKEYYASQTTSSIGIKVLGTFIATPDGDRFCFAAMNMMYEPSCRVP